jgi:biotin carboxyl carrier protein
VDLKDIKAIIDLMKKNSITEFELERQDSKIRLKRGLNGGAHRPNKTKPGSMPVPSPVLQLAVGVAPAASHKFRRPQPAKLTLNLR